MDTDNHRVTRAAAKASGHGPLPDKFEDIVALAKGTALPTNTLASEGKLAMPEYSRFYRFMDLPAELREEIYYWAMQLDETNKPRDLLNLRQPVLALVSKLIRKEALRVFVKRLPFYIERRAKKVDMDHMSRHMTYEDMETAVERIELYEERELSPLSPKHTVGPLRLSKLTRRWLLKDWAGGKPLYFGNIEVRIFLDETTIFPQYTSWRLNACDGKPTEFLIPEDYEFLPLQKVLERLTSVASNVFKEIVEGHVNSEGKPHHTGFTFNELKRIAMAIH